MNAHKLELQLGALLKRFNFEYIYANDFLRIVKPTEENLEKYMPYLGIPKTWRLVLLISKFIPKIAYESIRSLTISLIRHNQSMLPNLQLTGDLNAVFISHFTDMPMNPRLDPYYGEIPTYLQKQGGKISILYLNHTQRKTNRVNQQLAGVGLESVVVIPKSLPFHIQIRVTYQLLIQSFKILNSALFSRELSLQERFLLVGAAIFQVHRSTLSNVNFTFQVIDWIKKVSPRNIVITFEGHAFEILAVREIEKKFPNTKIFLYQHAPVIPDQFGLIRTLQEIGTEVRIFTTGEVTRFFFENHSRHKELSIEILGSPKFLSKNFLREISTSDVSYQKTCLIAPEGTLRTTSKLLELAVQLSSLVPDFDFIFRLHPALQHSSRLKQLLQVDFPSNLTFSGESLRQDLRNSGYCIYRSSAVPIEGLFFGVRPIHFSSQDEVDLDPLSLTHLGNESFGHLDSFVSYFSFVRKSSFASIKPIESSLFEEYEQYLSPLNLELADLHLLI